MTTKIKEIGKLSKIVFILFCHFSFAAMTQTQPWVEDNAIWKYRFEDQNLGGQFGLYKVYKTGNVIIGGQLCDELVTKKYSYELSSNWQISDSIIIDTNYTYLSITGDSVMYEQNGIFRVLYNFAAEVGDSLLIHVSSEIVPATCHDSSFAFITSNSLVNISSVSYRLQTVGKSSDWNDSYTLGSYPIGFGDGINERFGAVQYDVDGYLFPVHESNCYSESLLFRFLCYSDDSLTYDVDCDYFETLGHEEVDELEIQVYPNPFQTHLFVDGNFSNDDILITNIFGQVIKRIGTSELPAVNLSDLKTGVYWLKYSDSFLNVKQIKIIKLN
jgi:hypothetical protein